MTNLTVSQFKMPRGKKPKQPDKRTVKTKPHCLCHGYDEVMFRMEKE